MVKEINVVIPKMELPSLANSRMHWAAKAKIVKEQRTFTAFYLFGVDLPQLPVVITLTRIGKRLLDTQDNLPMAFKHVVDEIARKYGVDDASELYTFRYDQRTCSYCSIEISIVSKEDVP